MRTRAAILRDLNTPWSVEEIELDPPKRGEVLVKMFASGMCHSDEHAYDGHIAGLVPGPPMIGGHEGSGVVQEVGEGVYGLEPGDHVVFGFIPACGRCPECAGGHSNLCDMLATFTEGTQALDGTSRHHTLDGQDLGLMCLLGTFSEHTVVNEASVVKIDRAPRWPALAPSLQSIRWSSSGKRPWPSEQRTPLPPWPMPRPRLVRSRGTAATTRSS